MPTVLNPECEARLLAILEAELPKAIVDHGQFVRSASLAGLHEGNNALPTKTRAQFAEWVSDNPFSSFIDGLLTARVLREFPFEPKTSAKLVDLPGYSDVPLLAKHLLAAFSSLPWRYTLFFPLSLQANEEDHDTTREYPLTDDASLIAPGQDFVNAFPVLPDEEPITPRLTDRDVGPRSWAHNRYYLKMTLSGFIEDLVSTRPIEEASFFLRSLAGLLLSSTAVESKTTYPIPPTESPFFTYRTDATGNYLLGSHMLASDYSEKLRTLQWVEVADFQGPKWPQWMDYFQRRLRPALTTAHEQNAVRRAAQWYFDSECGRNELLQFVQATVAIEILLGNKPTSDVVGIAELLANRCAYLLAGSHDERSRILRDMKALYDTRSAIVHRGKHRLTRDESVQLMRLQFYCRMAIGKEMHLLVKNVGAPE